jgi:hypothetical protein
MPHIFAKLNGQALIVDWDINPSGDPIVTHPPTGMAFEERGALVNVHEVGLRSTQQTDILGIGAFPAGSYIAEIDSEDTSDGYKPTIKVTKIEA